MEPRYCSCSPPYQSQKRKKRNHWHNKIILQWVKWKKRSLFYSPISTVLSGHASYCYRFKRRKRQWRNALTECQKSSSASANNFICSNKEPLSLAANTSIQFWSNMFFNFFFFEKIVNFKVYWYLNFELIFPIQFSTSD